MNLNNFKSMCNITSKTDPIQWHINFVQAKWFSSLMDRVFSWCFLGNTCWRILIVWDVDTRMEKYRVEGRSLPTWTKTYIMELLAIWDFSLKLYTYKSAKFYLRKQEARFYWVWSDVEVVVFASRISIHRQARCFRETNDCLIHERTEKTTTTAAINWIC